MTRSTKRNTRKPKVRRAALAVTPGSAFERLTAKQMCEFIDRHSLQITKGGYRWSDAWEISAPAPMGHYMECAERAIAHGKTATEALRSAHKKITSRKKLPNQ